MCSDRMCLFGKYNVCVRKELVRMDGPQHEWVCITLTCGQCLRMEYAAETHRETCWQNQKPKSMLISASIAVCQFQLCETNDDAFESKQIGNNNNNNNARSVGLCFFKIKQFLPVIVSYSQVHRKGDPNNNVVGEKNVRQDMCVSGTRNVCFLNENVCVRNVCVCSGRKMC